MGSFNNRLNCGCTGKSSTTTTEPKKDSSVTTTGSETKSDTTVKVTQPTVVNDKPCCKSFTVTHVTKIGDEVYITLDDCTFLKAPFSVVDTSVTSSDNSELTELQGKVTALEEKTKVLDNLVDVADFGDNVKVKGIAVKQ